MDLMSVASALVLLAAVIVLGNAAVAILRVTNAFTLPLGLCVRPRFCQEFTTPSQGCVQRGLR